MKSELPFEKFFMEARLEPQVNNKLMATRKAAQSHFLSLAQRLDHCSFRRAKAVSANQASPPTLPSRWLDSATPLASSTPVELAEMK